MFSPPALDSDANVKAGVEKLQDHSAVSLVHIKGGKYSETVGKGCDDQNADAIIYDNAVRLRKPQREFSDEESITLENVIQMLADWEPYRFASRSTRPEHCPRFP